MHQLVSTAKFPSEGARLVRNNYTRINPDRFANEKANATNMTDAVGTTLFGYTRGGLLASEDALRPTQLHGSA